MNGKKCLVTVTLKAGVRYRAAECLGKFGGGIVAARGVALEGTQPVGCVERTRGIVQERSNPGGGVLSPGGVTEKRLPSSSCIVTCCVTKKSFVSGALVCPQR